MQFHSRIATKAWGGNQKLLSQDVSSWYRAPPLTIAMINSAKVAKCLLSHIRNSLNLAHGSMSHLYLCAMWKSYVISNVILLAFDTRRHTHTHINQCCVEIRQVGFELLLWEVFQPFSGFVSSGYEPCYWLCFLPPSPFQGHSFKGTRWILKTGKAEAGQFY